MLRPEQNRLLQPAAGSLPSSDDDQCSRCKEVFGKLNLPRKKRGSQFVATCIETVSNCGSSGWSNRLEVTIVRPWNQLKCGHAMCHDMPLTLPAFHEANPCRAP
jgi:hypothetical protein